MSIYRLRSCFAVGDLSLSCCRHTEKFRGSTLQTPLNLRHSFKTSNWNPSRWPGRTNKTNSMDNCQGMYALGRLWKPLGFTVAVSGVSFLGAAIWQYESVRRQAVFSKYRLWSSGTQKYGQIRQQLNQWWRDLSEGEKVFAPICFLNLLVLVAWRVPAWQPVMSKYFMSGLGSTHAVCWSMLFSVFSHYSFLHFAANMYVLHSFCQGTMRTLGKEQFVFMYLTAGVVSSLTSLLYKIIVKSPNPSLGASGAVMCVLAYHCSKYPNSKLAVIFLPMFPFEAGTGLKVLMGFDSLGCIFNWAFFDHAAHLGGSLFGLFWYRWGEHIWKKRGPLVSVWHQLRGPVQ